MSTQVTERSKRNLLCELIPRLRKKYGTDFLQRLAAGISFTLTPPKKCYLFRFPEDFMFSLTREEIGRISQIVISLKFYKSVLAFTEQGVAMLSGILNSDRAILVNIQIMRAFVNLRRAGLTYVGLKRKIEAMESKYDSQFKVVFIALKKLFDLPVKEKRVIGFK